MFSYFILDISYLQKTLGVVRKFRHGLKGEGGGQGFYDISPKASVSKSVTMEDGSSKYVQNCVTSFMNDPLASLVNLTKLQA
jgi:hypothetical protein